MARRGGKDSGLLLAVVLSAIGSLTPVAQVVRGQNPPPPTNPQAPPPVAAQSPLPAKPAAPPRPSFERVWQPEFEATSPLYLTATADLVFVAGPQAPVVARRAADGTEAWKSDHGSDVEPVAGDGLLIVANGGSLRALEMTGGVKWSVDVAPAFGGDLLPLGGPGALFGAVLPVPSNARKALTWTTGSLLVASGRDLRALRTSDGAELWRATLSAPVIGRVAIDGGRVFAGLADNRLIALDLVSGKPVWHKTIAATPGPLAAAAGQLYFGGSDGACYAYRQRDGEQKWRFLRLVPTVGTPAADARHAYFVLLTNQFLALDRESGNERWDERFAARLSHGIKAAGGSVFVALGDGAAFMLQANDGAVTAIRSAPPPAERSSAIVFESFDVAPDGTQVYTLTEVARRYTLSAYRRK